MIKVITATLCSVLIFLAGQCIGMADITIRQGSQMTVKSEVEANCGVVSIESNATLLVQKGRIFNVSELIRPQNSVFFPQAGGRVLDCNGTEYPYFYLLPVMFLFLEDFQNPQ